MTTNQKVHVALNTNKFDESVTFYSGFFGKKPMKLKSGDAKFELDTPGLNITLNKSAHAPKGPSSLNHLGIQVSSTEEVADATKRLAGASFTTLEENDTVCCYALQDKVWVADPNGYRWEIFVVKEDDVTDKNDPAVQAAASEEPCCEPTCCS